MGSRDSQKAVTTWLNLKDVERLDRLAQKIGVTRASLIESIVSVNLPELEAMDDLGFFKAALIWRDLKASLRAWVENAEMDPKSVGMS